LAAAVSDTGAHLFVEELRTVSTLHVEAVISIVTVVAAQGQSSAIFTSHSKAIASRLLTSTS